MAILFVVILLAMAWLRINYPKRIQKLFISSVNVRLLRQMVREEFTLTSTSSFVLNILAVIGISLLLYVSQLAFGVSPVKGIGLVLFGKLSLLVVVIYTIKIMGIRAVQILSDGDHGLSEYVFNIFVFNQLAGLALIPLMAIAVYVSSSVVAYLAIAGAVVLGGAILIRIVRGLGNALRNHVRPFYIVLYLCALEFLPLALLIKVILP